MKKIVLALMAVLFLGTTTGLVMAQDTGSTTATKATKTHKGGKKGHKGGKKGKKGSSTTSSAPATTK